MLTDEEFAQRQEALKRQFAGFVLGAWGEQGGAQRQTSLIVDPKDGSLPALTAEGRRRAPYFRSSWQNIPWDWVDDFDTWDRCITRGLPPSMLPMQYSNGLQIHQSPGDVVLRVEMIHEARIIPLGKPPLGKAITQWLGASSGHFEGNSAIQNFISASRAERAAQAVTPGAGR